MKNVSLIKKIKYDPSAPNIYPVTFDIGQDIDRCLVKDIYGLIKEKDLLAKDSLSLGKDCFTVHISLDNIPKIADILSENSQKYIGIYVLYDNFLEMEER